MRSIYAYLGVIFMIVSSALFSACAKQDLDNSRQVRVKNISDDDVENLELVFYSVLTEETFSYSFGDLKAGKKSKYQQVDEVPTLAEASLLIDGQHIKATGIRSPFWSPPLPAGKHTYLIDIKDSSTGLLSTTVLEQ